MVFKKDANNYKEVLDLFRGTFLHYYGFNEYLWDINPNNGEIHYGFLFGKSDYTIEIKTSITETVLSGNIDLTVFPLTFTGYDLYPNCIDQTPGINMRIIYRTVSFSQKNDTPLRNSDLELGVLNLLDIAKGYPDEPFLTKSHLKKVKEHYEKRTKEYKDLERSIYLAM